MLARVSSLLLALLLVPVIHAGSAQAPELTDAANDAPAPLDVVAAWWGTPAAPLVTDADVPDTGTDRVDNYVRNRLPAGDRLEVVVQLRDLDNSQPLLGDRAALRHFYAIRFTPVDTGRETLIVCLLNYADTIQPIGILPWFDRPDEFSTVGLFCGPRTNTGVPGADFYVEGRLDHAADTLVVTLVERDVAIDAGSAFLDLQVETSRTVVGGTPLAQKVVTDTTGKGLTFTVS